MKVIFPKRVASRRGMTLLELTVVVATLLSLISILFIGARAWKRGSDKAMCLMNLRQIQVAVRSYQNLHGYNPGGQPDAVGGTQDISQHLLDRDFISLGLYHYTQSLAVCPGGGEYTRESPNTFPQPGVLYMECSLAETEEHKPADASGW